MTLRKFAHCTDIEVIEGLKKSGEDLKDWLEEAVFRGLVPEEFKNNTIDEIILLSANYIKNKKSKPSEKKETIKENIKRDKKVASITLFMTAERHAYIKASAAKNKVPMQDFCLDAQDRTFKIWNEEGLMAKI